jgi:hypothetical protein
MEDRRMLPSEVLGKTVEFQSSSVYKGEHIYNISFTDGSNYYFISDSPIRIYSEDEI